MTQYEFTILERAQLRPGGNPASGCLACGACSGACPMTGASGFDPRRLVRLALLGRDAELVESRLPWLCTMCAKCEQVCPMGVNITGLVRAARGLARRDQVPGQIQKGVELAMDSGNNLGLPEEDFRFILEDVAGELAEEPGYEDFELPIEASGARLLTTLHNKLVNTQNEDLVHWWKIFHRAGESFTIPSKNWEGVNWGLFSGDDASMKVYVDRIVENMDRLEASHLMYPE